MLENWNGNKAEWPLLTKDAPILASVSVSVLILRILALYQYLLPNCDQFRYLELTINSTASVLLDR